MKKSLSDSIEITSSYYPDIVGVTFDPNSNENCAYFFPNLKDHQDIVRQFEDFGLSVVFPAELSEEAVSSMSISSKSFYEKQLKSGLVIDPNEACLSGNFLEKIGNHYYSTVPNRMAGFTKFEDGTIGITEYNYYGTKEDINTKYYELLNSVGFPVVMENGNVVARSIDPYVSVLSNETTNENENENESSIHR